MEKYGIHPSTAIRWIEKEGGVLMVPDSEDPIKSARGMFSGYCANLIYHNNLKLHLKIPVRIFPF